MSKWRVYSVVAFTLGGLGAAVAQEPIDIVGSSTVYPYTKLVADAFAEQGKHPPPTIRSTGTGGGMAVFCAGIGPDYPDMTGASRPMKHSEWEICRDNGVFDITEMMIGYDGLTLATPRTTDDDFILTLQDLYTALAKTVPIDGELRPNPHTTWADVRSELPDIPISVIGPPPTSGTRDSFEELAMQGGCRMYPVLAALEDTDGDEWTRICSTIRTDGPFVEGGEDDEEIVRVLSEKPGTLGIFGYSYYYQNTSILKPVLIEGISPDFLSISTREYPLSRPLYLYIKNESREFTPGIVDFINEFLYGASPGGYLFVSGLVPVLDDVERETIAAYAIDGEEMLPPAD
ncbi:MAG: substrate-binding domain-containing protein [Devosia sp.]